MSWSEISQVKVTPLRKWQMFPGAWHTWGGSGFEEKGRSYLVEVVGQKFKRGHAFREHCFCASMRLSTGDEAKVLSESYIT